MRTACQWHKAKAKTYYFNLLVDLTSKNSAYEDHAGSYEDNTATA